MGNGRKRKAEHPENPSQLSSQSTIEESHLLPVELEILILKYIFGSVNSEKE